MPIGSANRYGITDPGYGPPSSSGVGTAVGGSMGQSGPQVPAQAAALPVAPPKTISNPVAAHLDAHYQQRLTELTNNLAAAKRNMDVGSWGGSADDARHWQRVAAGHQSDLDNLQKNYQSIMDQANAGAIDASQIKTAKDAMAGDAISNEKLSEAAAGKQQLDTQNKQLSDLRDQNETQMFGGKGLSLSDALTSTGGDIGNLNKFLGQQESQTFNQQLKPLIQMALGSQGLSDSGANIELQSKALGQLEQQRQQSMMQAALGGRAQLQGMQRSDLLGGIGLAQQNMTNQSDLARTGITMAFQQQLENQRADLARELSKYQGGAGGGGIGSLVGMGIGGALGAFGGPQGAMMGAGVGGMLGGGIGNAVSPGSSGNGVNTSPFISGSSFFNQRQRQPSQQAIGPTAQAYSGMGSTSYRSPMFGPYMPST